MAGNSSRRGAVRTAGSKKGPLVGSGGQRRRGLEGKGPTPKAADRPNHKAYQQSGKGSSGGGQSGGGFRRGPGSASPRKKKASSEMVAGRNSVLEALRADVPANTLYVASRIDADDRVREAIKLAGERGIPMLETPRAELDRLTDGAVHQGLAVQVPPYTYAHPADLIDPPTPGVPLLVALDGITDPRNLGAIVRSVAAFGGHGVIVPARRSVGMTASAWKTSAGAAARIPVAQALVPDHVGDSSRSSSDFAGVLRNALRAKASSMPALYSESRCRAIRSAARMPWLRRIGASAPVPAASWRTIHMPGTSRSVLSGAMSGAESPIESAALTSVTVAKAPTRQPFANTRSSESVAPTSPAR